MKKHFFTWILSGIFIIACNNNKTNDGFGETVGNTEGNKVDNNKNSTEGKGSKDLTGLWKPVHIEAEDMSEEEKNEVLNGASIEFTASGNYISTTSKDSQHGKYSFDEMTQTLKLEAENRTQTIKLEWIGKNKIILSDENGKVTIERQ